MAHITTSLFLIAATLPGVSDSKVVEIFQPREYQYTGGRYDKETIKYRLFVPQPLESGKKYPLLLWLHGAGDGGTDNKTQLVHMQHHFQDTKHLERYPFFVLATQCPADNRDWGHSIVSATESPSGKDDAPITIAMEILDSLIKEYPIDKDRVYLLGISAGGTAVWETVLRYPNRFAAISPISSTGMSDFSRLERFKNTPVWAFNCTYDSGAPIEKVRQTIQRINQAGGVAHLTEFPSNSHKSWIPALRECKVVDWMLKQQRGKRCWVKPYRKPWKASEIAMQGGVVACIALIGIVAWRQKRSKRPAPSKEARTETADRAPNEVPSEKGNHVS